MKQRHESLRRGQGLVSLYWSALIARGRTYLTVILISAACTATALPALILNQQERQYLKTYAVAEFKLLFTEGQTLKPYMKVEFLGRPLKMRADRVQRHPLYRGAYIKAKDWAIAGALLGILLGAGLCVVLFRIFEESGAVSGQDDILRGTLLTTPKGLQKLLKPHLNDGWFRLAGIHVPEALSTRHLAVIGATGSGKSVFIRDLLDQATANHQAAVVFDNSGEQISLYYQPSRGDIILDPIDSRGVFWDIMAEVRAPAEAAIIAQKLIPDGSEHEETIWTETAQNLLSNILMELVTEGRMKISDLLQTLQSTSSDDLKAWLATTSSARVFTQGAEKASASVLFTISKAINTLQLLKHEEANAKRFTFHDYFETLDQIKGPKPWVFVPRREHSYELTKGLLACWLELASTGIMKLEPNERRRVWYFVDEFPELPKTVNFPRLLPLGRKYGACIILSCQSIGQLRLRYKPDGAEALLANCNTKLLLQATDFATRLYGARLIGEVEAELRSDSDNLDFEHGKGRTTIGKQRQIRPAILESELRLPPFTGYLILPDGKPVTRVTLSNKHIIARGPARQPGFIQGDIADTLYGRKGTPPESNIDFSAGPV